MSGDEGRADEEQPRGTSDQGEHGAADDAELEAQLAERLAVPPREPSAANVARVRADAEARRTEAAGTQGGDEGPTSVRHGRRPRRREVLVGGIAAGVGLVTGAGAAEVILGGSDTDGDSDVPTEPIELAGAPEGLTVAGHLIDHTWGVELVVQLDGLVGREAYDVRYRTTSGEQVVAGSFLADPELTVVCRCTAAVLRRDLAEVSVEQRQGPVRLVATLA